MQLSEIQKYLDNFSEKHARGNMAAYKDFPTDGSFSGRLLCGFAKEKGELKLQTPSGQSIDIAADSGLQLQGETVIPKQVDEQKINQMQNLKQAIVNVAVVDQEKIEQIMQKKIFLV